MQQRKQLLKYILDIESVINELERIVGHHQSDYNDFSANFISVRAVERDLMIVGEAVGKMISLDPDTRITSAKRIIGLRNMLVHAYDAIDPTTLWRILIVDLPVLKEEMAQLKS